ncbi:MAG: T9SS type A sorting domain-containing protein [Bacteroidales bacterium]|nr:T9SS type A sorting domain-containing protein [Bacteroidales bacterium]
MKITKILLLKFFALLSIFILIIISLYFAKIFPKKTFLSKQTAVVKGEIKACVEYLNRIRTNQNTGKINYLDVLQAQKQIDALIKNKSKGNLEWKEVGPINIGGRTRAILVDKKNNKRLYAGGVSGGLWVSEDAGINWLKVNIKGGTTFDDFENLCISSLAQDNEGTIYAGTGEQFSGLSGTGNNTGFLGKGIYKSTDGVNFSVITSTIPKTVNDKWCFVNDLECNPVNGWLFAATSEALYLSKDKGETWELPVKYPGTISYKGKASDIDISGDQTVVASVNNTLFVSVNGGDNGTFVRKANGLPSTSKLLRIEFALAPSNSNYLYALAANNSGALEGVYRSVDKGDNWQLIGPGGSKFFLVFGSNNQGWFDNEIVVFPDNPNKILIGGVSLWQWELNKSWTRISDYGYPIHIDIHKIVFDPVDPKTYYVGTDGGIYKTQNAGDSYYEINNNFITTQFYAIAFSGKGDLIGGTQDNATVFMERNSNSKLNGKIIAGGDGGWAAFSLINPSAIFFTFYNGNCIRSSDKTNQKSWQFPTDWYSGNNKWGQLSYYNSYYSSFPAPFITPIILWESFNDNYSKDYINFKADKIYKLGDTITVNSKNSNFPFDYILTKDLSINDTVNIKDKIQSKFFLAFSNRIWLTRAALDFKKKPKWYNIANIPDYTNTMSLSKDGNTLFVGTYNGTIYRIANIRLAFDSLTTDVNSKFSVILTSQLLNFVKENRTVTSIAVNPNNPSHIIITLGNYGNTDYVYESRNAMDSIPTFSLKQGNLPKMPVYSSLIEMNNPDKVIIATEYGIFSTDKISSASPVWQEENQGMERVGTYMLKQQIYNYDGDYVPTQDMKNPYSPIKLSPWLNVNNLGVIYAATHGRGIFESYNYSIPLNIKNCNDKPSSLLFNIFPNPVRDILYLNFNTKNFKNLIISIYDIDGKKVYSSCYDISSNLSLNLNFLKDGIYLIKAETKYFNKQDKYIAKFIISK